MKKLLSFLLLIIIIGGGITAWLVFGSGTAFSEKNRYFIIEEGHTGKDEVLATLDKKYIVKNPAVLGLLGTQMNVWEKIKPGKYEVKNGASLLSIARMLRNGSQAQINLVITKLRTKEDFAHLVSKNFAADSTSIMQFLSSNDSLKSYDVDTNTVFTLIIPDTYSFYWNTPLRRIMQKLKDSKDNFWSKNDRRRKVEQLNITPEQAYVVASIVEEETNKDEDKGKIASVYLNRINKGMPLQADPTVKFALKDFAITRISFDNLKVQSPYNTYYNKGLPPGPICTPSPKTLDMVINAPATDYLYFVAKSDLNGYHQFTSNFAEHKKYADEYRKALDAYFARKQQTTNP